MHAAAAKLHDMNGYSEAEIIAARGAANYMAFIKSEPDAGFGEEQADGSFQMEMEPGLFQKLAPGEDVNFISPNRPNPNMDPFMRMMLREVAAAVGVSYESLSRDYSQSNYSSSRLALIDDRDLWRTLQQWFIRSFREPLHREWLQAAVLSRAVGAISLDEFAASSAKFEAARWKPRGWTWVDPTKEVQAYKDAVLCGFTTVTDVIAATGGGTDIEDVLQQRERELQLMQEKGLTFESTPQEKPEPAPAAAPAAEDEEDAEEEESPASDRVIPMRVSK